MVPSPAIILLAVLASTPARAGQGVPHGLGPREAPDLARTRLAFVENRGQWDCAFPFAAFARGGLVGFEADAITIDLRRRERRRIETARLRLSFEGALPEVRIRGEDPRRALYNFYRGSDPQAWRRGVPSFGSVFYRGLYQCVDLRVREETGRLEYDLLLGAGADLEQVVVRAEGADALAVGPDGSLSILTALGEIRERPPRTWKVSGPGKRESVPCRYRLLGTDRYGFAAAGRDPELPLVIDPGLEWSTLLGGSGAELVLSLAVAADGTIVMAGSTSSSDFDFPVKPGAYQVVNGGNLDAFAGTFDPDTMEVTSMTFLGGSNDDEALGLAFDSGGAIVLAGSTASSNFSTTGGAFDRTYSGGRDAFLARLSTGGEDLLYSTFLGGPNEEMATGLAVNGAGHAFVTGFTASTGFPTTRGSFRETYQGGGNDVFLVGLKPDPNLEPDEQLTYSTFLGGSSADTTSGASDVNLLWYPQWNLSTLPVLALLPSGAVAVAGATYSPDFPRTAGAYDGSFGQGIGQDTSKHDAFVAVIQPDRKLQPDEQLLYSTFLGGVDDEGLNSIQVDASGDLFLAGNTWSGDFPTTAGSFNGIAGGLNDVYLVRLRPDNSLPPEAQLVYSTRIGGSNKDSVPSMALDASGAVTLAGYTISTNFPTTPGAFQSGFQGGVSDAYLVRLKPDSSIAPEEQLIYSSYFGGPGEDQVLALALDARGNAIVAGTCGPDFPATAGAPDARYDGGDADGFLARFHLAVPRAAFTVSPTIGVEPLVVSVDASASSSPESRIVSYDWEFGDGGTARGAFAIHTYTAFGLFPISLTVTNELAFQALKKAQTGVHFRSNPGTPWTAEDIGIPAWPGGARPEGACLRVLGSGNSFSAKSDQFHFVHQEVEGDLALIARFAEFTPVATSRVGLMLREDLDPGARFASMNLRRQGSLFEFLRRPTVAASTVGTNGGGYKIPVAWVRIERRGNLFIGSSSHDGRSWTEVGRETLDLPRNLLAGIASTGKSPQGPADGVLSLACDITIEKPEPHFLRGDSDGSGSADITDVVVVLGSLFLGTGALPCTDAADADDSGVVDISDPIYTLNWQFLGGPQPSPPGPSACGEDPTSDGLEPCAPQPGCEN
jgi:hypothetical protein